MVDRTLNARQLEVLQWIVEGCNPEVMTGTTHKTTAIALQNRRLVSVSKKRGVWKAEATAAGRYFLEHGAYPEGHWTTPASASSVSPPAAAPNGVRAVGPKITAVRPVDQMIADVIEASGRLDVTDPRGHYEGLVSAAARHNKIPDGKMLKIEQRPGWGNKTLVLSDKPAWMTTELAPIPVSDRLARPHPAVAALRADKDRLRFKADTRQRALRLLDAVAKEATARGWEVACPTRDRYQHGALPALTIAVQGHPHSLQVTEDSDRVPHEPTQKEIRQFEKWGYPRIPKHDKIPSGRLVVAINGGIPVRQSSFGDTKTMDLTDRLPHLLQELELRAAGAEERRLERERADAERRRQWEKAKDDAVEALREHRRAKALLQQADKWREVQLLRDYVSAMESRVEDLDESERQEAVAWLTWATTHVEQSDPLLKTLGMPPDPEPTPEALKPFMKGWSPYGPDRAAW